jgi:hypothetical protein
LAVAFNTELMRIDVGFEVGHGCSREAQTEAHKKLKTRKADVLFSKI